MKTLSDSEKRCRTFLNYATAFVLGGVFVWLKWWSGVWQNRWVGFILGIVFAAVALIRDWGRVGHDIQTKGFYLRLSLLFFFVGTVSLVRFFRGANGDEALFGFIMLAFGTQYAYVYRRVYQQDRLNLETKG
jgi:hypothetical protein